MKWSAPLVFLGFFSLIRLSACVCLCELDWPQCDNQGAVEVNDTPAKKPQSALSFPAFFPSSPVWKKDNCNAGKTQTRKSASNPIQRLQSEIFNRFNPCICLSVCPSQDVRVSAREERERKSSRTDGPSVSRSWRLFRYWVEFFFCPHNSSKAPLLSAHLSRGGGRDETRQSSPLYLVYGATEPTHQWKALTVNTGVTIYKHISSAALLFLFVFTVAKDKIKEQLTFTILLFLEADKLKISPVMDAGFERAEAGG